MEKQVTLVTSVDPTNPTVFQNVVDVDTDSNPNAVTLTLSDGSIIRMTGGYILYIKIEDMPTP